MEKADSMERLTPLYEIYITDTTACSSESESNNQEMTSEQELLATLRGEIKVLKRALEDTILIVTNMKDKHFSWQEQMRRAKNSFTSLENSLQSGSHSDSFMHFSVVIDYVIITDITKSVRQKVELAHNKIKNRARLSI